MAQDQITFDAPPLDEVTIGRQFLHRSDFLIPHFGAYWERVRDRLPKVAHAPPIVDGAEQSEVMEEFAFLPRVWLLTADEAQLVQLQQNRFHYNWRRRGETSTYVRFKNVLADALLYWDALDSAVDEMTGKRLQPTRAELTYVNFLEIEGVKSAGEVMERSLKDFRWNSSSRHLRSPSGAVHNVSFKVPDIDALLTVNAATATRASTKAKGVKLDLSVRGKCDDQHSFESWAKKAHEFLLSSFVDLTTPEMHKLWRLEGNSNHG